MFTATFEVAANLDEHNTAEFIADTIEIPEPILIARSANYEILLDIGAYWLYRRHPEYCPPGAELLCCIPDRLDLFMLHELFSRAIQETDPLTNAKAVVV